MPCLDEPVGRVKKTNNKIYYPTRQIVMSVQANFADIFLLRMRDRSMRSGTELAREIQLTDCSTAGEHFRQSHPMRNLFYLSQREKIVSR